MFYIQRLYDKYAIVKYYPDTAATETWKYADSYEDAIELCHYMNGGSDRDYHQGKYKVYEWKLVPYGTEGISLDDDKADEDDNW